MPSRRVISGVLNNFIGTFTSRYSDFDGYWVFGFLAESIDTVRIDLLGNVPDKTDSTPSDFTHRLAKQKFGEQLAKAGLPKNRFREAYLNISKSPHSTLGFVNGQGSSGYDFKFQAHVITDLGRVYESKTSVFVAPHDPKVESRSARAVSTPAPTIVSSALRSRGKTDETDSYPLIGDSASRFTSGIGSGSNTTTKFIVHVTNKRGCYCGIWDKNPAHFESQGVPRGYCGFCRVCKRPGHTRHFPGAVPFTSCWCDFHYRLVSLIHPLGFPGSLLYFGIAAAVVILWLVFKH